MQRIIANAFGPVFNSDGSAVYFSDSVHGVDVGELVDYVQPNFQTSSHFVSLAIGTVVTVTADSVTLKDITIIEGGTLDAGVAEEKFMDTELKRHRREAEEIVSRNYPGARVERVDDSEGTGFRVFVGVDPISDVWGSPEKAWESALFKLTQLNALLDWRAAGSPLFNAVITLASWLTAEDKLEGHHHIPTPPEPGR